MAKDSYGTVALKAEVGPRAETTQTICAALSDGKHAWVIGPPDSDKDQLAVRLHRSLEGAHTHVARLRLRSIINEQMYADAGLWTDALVAALRQQARDALPRGVSPPDPRAAADGSERIASAFEDLVNAVSARKKDESASQEPSPTGRTDRTILLIEGLEIASRVAEGSVLLGALNAMASDAKSTRVSICAFSVLRLQDLHLLLGSKVPPGAEAMFVPFAVEDLARGECELEFDAPKSNAARRLVADEAYHWTGGHLKMTLRLRDAIEEDLNALARLDREDPSEEAARELVETHARRLFFKDPTSVAEAAEALETLRWAATTPLRKQWPSTVDVSGMARELRAGGEVGPEQGRSMSATILELGGLVTRRGGVPRFRSNRVFETIFSPERIESELFPDGTSVDEAEGWLERGGAPAKRAVAVLRSARQDAEQDAHDARTASTRVKASRYLLGLVTIALIAIGLVLSLLTRAAEKRSAEAQQKLQDSDRQLHDLQGQQQQQSAQLVGATQTATDDAKLRADELSKEVASRKKDVEVASNALRQAEADLEKALATRDDPKNKAPNNGPDNPALLVAQQEAREKEARAKYDAANDALTEAERAQTDAKSDQGALAQQLDDLQKSQQKNEAALAEAASALKDETARHKACESKLDQQRKGAIDLRKRLDDCDAQKTTCESVAKVPQRQGG